MEWWRRHGWGGNSWLCLELRASLFFHPGEFNEKKQCLGFLYRVNNYVQTVMVISDFL